MYSTYTVYHKWVLMMMLMVAHKITTGWECVKQIRSGKMPFFFIKFPPILHTSLLFYDDDDDDDDKDDDDDVRSFFRWHGCCRLLMRRPRGPKCHFHDASPAACLNTHFFHDQHFEKRRKNKD